MPEAVKNSGASVRARLLRVSKEKGQNFDLVLTHYAIERLLYRLAQSRHADRFVLKGAIMNDLRARELQQRPNVVVICGPKGGDISGARFADVGQILPAPS